jgi:hypothetical protein
VGWWPFNGNANDESGNGNNGFVSGATLTADRFGTTNKAYSFDEINDYIIANSLTSYISDILSISLWVNTTITPPLVSNYTVFELGGTGNTGVRWGCIAEPNNAVMAIGRGCSGTGNTPVSNNYTGGWANFVFVITVLNHSLYLNGVLLAFQQIVKSHH